MNSFWELPAVVVMLLTWLASPPAGLGDAAKREALRRSLTPKATRAYVVEDQAAIRPGAQSDLTTPPATPPTVPDEDGGPIATKPGAAAPPAAAAAPAAAPAPSAAARDQESWRNRITIARENLARDQVLAEAMQSRINALATDIINRDDPAQRAKLATDSQRAVDELARLQKQIAADEKTILTIQDDARRQGVPPGWIR